MMIDAPILETARLRMRPPALQDFAASAQLSTDAAVMRFITGKAATREEAWARFLRWVGHWTLSGYGFWVVEEKPAMRFVGEVGLADFKRDIEPTMDGKMEAGWALAPWAHGRGFATEAMLAALAWSDRTFVGVDTFCMIDPEHKISLRVAEKCGYRETARTVHRDDLVVLLRRENPFR